VQRGSALEALLDGHGKLVWQGTWVTSPRQRLDLDAQPVAEAVQQVLCLLQRGRYLPGLHA
jgi:hypothetical protein